ncbi:hypothetical protein Acr_00g0067330 [Actinidia rufa]|uniref:Uncharacterized protein n=1 Tax=Actinidia rufa TaxID=165716 RepID=A0A7J0DSH0_9ERIC|nr:hypothetical protein Acr_00g0067330 [Actinidia rufa]
MRQMKLPFSVTNPLHVYTVVRQKREPSTPFLKGDHYLRLKNPRQSRMRHNGRLPDNKYFFIEYVTFILVNFYTDTDTCFFCCANFNELFKHRSEECKATIEAINNRQASRKVTDLPSYEPIYRHVISHKVKELSRIRLLALRTEGRAPQCATLAKKALALSSTGSTTSPSLRLGGGHNFKLFILHFFRLLKQRGGGRRGSNQSTRDEQEKEPGASNG